MKRKIIIILFSFLFLLAIYAGSTLAGGDKNQNQHDGEPVGEPNGDNYGDPSPNSNPANPNTIRIKTPVRNGTNE